MKQKTYPLQAVPAPSSLPHPLPSAIVLTTQASVLATSNADGSEPPTLADAHQQSAAEVQQVCDRTLEPELANAS